MTFREAAKLARDAAAGQLWLTHFSPALEDPAAFAQNALDVFPESTVGYDGLTLGLPFKDARAQPPPDRSRSART
jgi:ribonuclease Z